MAWMRRGKRIAEEAAAAAPEAPAQAPVPAADNLEASWNDVSQVDVLGLEVGYRLIPMVDKGQDGELLKRIRGLRKKFARRSASCPRRCTSATTSSSSPTATGSPSRASRSAPATPIPGQFLAINPGRVSGPLAGRETTDPAFGLPAVWIDASQREQAHALGYTVVDASTVVATHLNHVILSHAPSCSAAQETQALLDHIAKDAQAGRGPGAQAAAARPPCSACCRTCSTKASISATCAASSRCSPRTRRACRIRLELTTRVREALGRAIVQGLFPGNGRGVR
jgi:flagellar biosynthesis protein FlhA